VLKSSAVALDNPISSTVHHVNGNFLFDFRTSTLSIDRTAFLDKVLVDFVPHGFPGVRGEAGFASGGLPTAEDAVFPIDKATDEIQASRGAA
jgi:hypothetical protein